jgi:hypothetical protein
MYKAPVPVLQQITGDGADCPNAISAIAVEPSPRGVPFNSCSQTSIIQSVPKIATI